MDPRPIDDDLHLCYPAEYFTPATEPATVASGWKQAVRRQVLASERYRYPLRSTNPLLGRILSAMPPARDRSVHGWSAVFPSWVEGGRLLDVGCGTGSFLLLMRAFGWDVAGVETDMAASNSARDRHGLQIVPTIADAAELGPFDVVTMSHVIEHVADPAALISAAMQVLEPGGQLRLVTPNAGSLGLRVYGRDWLAMEAPRHLVIVTPEGMSAAMGRIGDVSGYSISTSARSASMIGREAARVRRYGRFQRGPLLPSMRSRGIGFSVAETVAVWADRRLGEELILIANKG
jgi:2-polyprenyl-3-methyl-5-hydroxy-6-metoxy-1,4-benzoquinol methylase